MEMDEGHWPRCLLWHGCQSYLERMVGLPWAEESAGNLLECSLGSYTSGLLSEWQLPAEFDAEGAAKRA